MTLQTYQTFSLENVLIFKIPKPIFLKQDTMVRIVSRLVQTHAVKLGSCRPYIQGEIKLQRARHKIFDQTFQTEKQCLDKYLNLSTI